MSPRVTLCAADPGCAEALIPVIGRLQGRAELSIFADAEGGAAARFAGQVPATAIANPARELAVGNVLLTVVAGKRQRFTLEASRAARAAGAQVVWIEPLYHAAQTGLNRSFVPDHLVVADRHAAAIYRAADYQAETHPLGQPALDGLAATDGAARRSAFRKDQGLGAEDRVLAYFASSSAQVDPEEALAPLSEALRGLPGVALIARFHPADPRRAELERSLARRCDRLIPSPSDDVAALHCADAVTVQFSTIGLKAVHLRKPLLYLWTPSVRRHFAAGEVARAEFPPITQGAALVARTHRQTLDALPRLLGDPRTRNRLLARQRARFPVQRDAAGAIAELVLGLA